MDLCVIGRIKVTLNSTCLLNGYEHLTSMWNIDEDKRKRGSAVKHGINVPLHWKLDGFLELIKLQPNARKIKKNYTDIESTLGYTMTVQCCWYLLKTEYSSPTFCNCASFSLFHKHLIKLHLCFICANISSRKII